MKAFHFKLEQALRWRQSQVDAQKARVAAALAKLAKHEQSLSRAETSLRAATGKERCGDGQTLQSFAAFRAVTLARIAHSESQISDARKAVAVEIARLTDLNQKSQVLDKLRSTQHSAWQRDLDRELAAFADESFLSRRAR